jgi:hypothetical protein
MTHADDPDIDFSLGLRGKFYRPDAAFVAPIQLEPAMLAFLQERAAQRGMALSAFVDLLPKKKWR